MEPMNVVYPQKNYLKNVKQICKKNKSLLIFDETITGFRFSIGGAQKLFNVKPDLSTFGKGIANGYPLSAIVGSKKIMKFMEEIFFSGTFGGETLSLAAANKVIEKMQKNKVIEKIYKNGHFLMEGIQLILNKNKLDKIINISGHPSWSFFIFKKFKKYTDQEIKTYFIQEVFKRGLLSIGTNNINYAFSIKDAKKCLIIYDEVFSNLRNILNEELLHQTINAKILNPIFKVR